MHTRNIFSTFFNMKVYCVYSIELPQGYSNEYTQYIIFNLKKEKLLQIIQNLQLWNFSKGLKNEFRTAMANDPSGFEPL